MKILSSDKNSISDTYSNDESINGLLEKLTCEEILDKEKFYFFVNYRGKWADEFVQSLYTLCALMHVVK